VGCSFERRTLDAVCLHEMLLAVQMLRAAHGT
jgi:hypothetical protein